VVSIAGDVNAHPGHSAPVRRRGRSEGLAERAFSGAVGDRPYLTVPANVQNEETMRDHSRFDRPTGRVKDTMSGVGPRRRRRFDAWHTGCGLLELLLGSALLAVAAGPARAQEEAAPDRWDGLFELGFSGATGNTSLAVLTTGFRIKHLQIERYELELSASYRYGESEGDVVARSMKGGLSYDLHPENAWSPFAFVDAERDAFRRIDVRTNAGAGVKRTFVNNDSASFSLSAAALHDYENFRNRTGLEPLAPRSNARWSFRAKGHRELAHGIRFDHVTFFQPLWDQADDYNIDTNSKATVLLTERVGITFSYTFRRDSTPPPDVEHNDQIIQAGVTIQM
jgi:putative salt-induced outer membrane protein YdiY